MSQPQRSASPSEIPQLPPLHALPTPPPARPDAVDPKVAKLICEYIRYDGLADHLAAALIRVSRARLERWKAEDEQFALDLAEARALFELDLLRRIRDARKSNGAPEWRAQVWLLQNASAEGIVKPARGAPPRPRNRPYKSVQFFPKLPPRTESPPLRHRRSGALQCWRKAPRMKTAQSFPKLPAGNPNPGMLSHRVIRRPWSTVRGPHSPCAARRSLPKSRTEDCADHIQNSAFLPETPRR